MRLLNWTLCGLIVWMVIVGIWDHNWTWIVAGTLVAVIWPLVGGDLVGDEEPQR